MDIQCPANMTFRRGYTRKNGVSVKSTCVPRKEQRKNSCKEGEIPRVAHTRRYTEKGIHKSAYIPASCVRRTSLIRPLHKGDLKKYGYSYKGNNASRRNALKSAVNAYGPLTTYHKLNAVAKLAVQYPKVSNIFQRDRNWVHNTYSKNGVLH